MTRKDLDTVAAMTDEQLALLTVVELSALTAMLAEKDAAHACKEQCVAEACGPLQEQITDLQRQLKESQALTDSLGGTELGQKLARERQMAELCAKRDEAIRAAKEAEEALASFQ